VKRAARFSHLTLAALLALSGCKEASGPVDADPPVTVSIEPGAITLASIGQRARLRATVWRSGKDITSTITVSWASLDGAVASVDQEGTVTALGNGIARVVASQATATDTADVTVSQRAVALAMTVESDSLAAGTAFAVDVRPIDSLGSVVPTTGGEVTLSVRTNVLGATLTGTVQSQIAGGHARFDSVSLNRGGQGFVLDATGAGLAVSSAPLTVELRLVEITVGELMSCGLGAEGEVYCWGSNARGGLGAGSAIGYGIQARPVLVAGGHRFKQIDAGGALNEASAGFVCGVTVEQDAFCWGHNTWGELGIGSIGGQSDEPARVAGGLKLRMVAAGAGHACAVATDGGLYCWGIYTGFLSDSHSGSPVRAAVQGRYTALYSSTGITTCARRENGPTECWPLSGGEPGERNLMIPRRIPGDLEFLEVRPSRSMGHWCGVVAGGEGYCWGSDAYGRLGTGSFQKEPVYVPTPVAGGHRWRHIVPASNAVCGLRMDGRAMCWGRDTMGELGQGGPVDEAGLPTPGEVVGGIEFAQVDANIQAACGLSVRGRPYCWGMGWDGQRGDGTKNARSYRPMAVLPPLANPPDPGR
jgi:alpha-tubulin suppressor-like RCC1 family protein